MERTEVYRRVDGERDYQDSFITGKKFEDKIHSVEAEILMMSSYIRKAEDAWTNNKGEEAALDVVRKIAGLAIRCLEHHGCPERQSPELV
jgi:hypothetical protein